MLQLNKYELYIFDCDGVILNSNKLKIKAMKNTLESHFTTLSLIDECVDYFRMNFGKSRFHHVKYFLDRILIIEPEDKSYLENLILADFSKQCRSLYLHAELTPGFILFLENCNGKKYVASGSEQCELRDVFAQRKLEKYFEGVYGSPTPKDELVRCIIEQEQNSNAVMFGDALSDLQAAQKNKIDFVFYSPYSTVQKELITLSKSEKFPILRSW
jgi:phosphoglycolate phosphatase-like HAD superfamily hydrolase